MPDNSDRIAQERDPRSPDRQLQAYSKQAQNRLYRCKIHYDEDSFFQRMIVSLQDLDWEMIFSEERTLVMGMAKYDMEINRISARAASTAFIHALASHSGLLVDVPPRRCDVSNMRNGRNWRRTVW